MSDAMSTYMENAVINAFLRGVSYTSTTVWVALFTDVADLTELEGNVQTNEVNQASYSRKSVTFAAPTGGTTSNSIAVDFLAAGEIWGNIRYAAIMNAETAGEVLFFGQLTVDKQINTSDVFKFNTNDLDVIVQ